MSQGMDALNRLYWELKKKTASQKHIRTCEISRVKAPIFPLKNSFLEVHGAGGDESSGSAPHMSQGSSPAMFFKRKDSKTVQGKNPVAENRFNKKWGTTGTNPSKPINYPPVN